MLTSLFQFNSSYVCKEVDAWDWDCASYNCTNQVNFQGNAKNHYLFIFIFDLLSRLGYIRDVYHGIKGGGLKRVFDLVK